MQLLEFSGTLMVQEKIIGYRIGLLVKWLIRLPVTQKITGSIPVQVANLVYVKDSEFNVSIQ